MKCDLGVFACNEQENIASALKAIISQKLDPQNSISKIFVIISGSTDKTRDIVKSFAQSDKRIVPVIQKKRKGKVSAVNLFLKKSKARNIIITNADNLLDKSAINFLLEGLKKRNIGLVASRVIPQNNPNTFFGFASHLQWTLHHKINLQFPDRPKAGELIGVKRVFQKLNHLVPTDEANIEAIVKTQGYDTKYVPEAIVYNYGPDNLFEFVSQRRRIYAQHLKVKHFQSYQVVTMSHLRLLGTHLSNIKFNNGFIIKSTLVMFLELYSRMLAFIDVYFFKKDHKNWTIVHSTKKQIVDNS